MSILCFIQGHSASDEQVWNRGYSFSRCRRCSCDMIRSDADWDVVPRGHRVVWKAGPQEHSRPAGYARNLPVLYRDVRGGVPALWSGGWYKQVLALAGGGTAESAVAVAAVLEDPEREPKQYPVLIALAAVAGASLHLILASRSRHHL
ncbi:MAG TPA: hypothetical protein VD887_00390 [Allosphingosinicella sp.]|nr:hypothetical protein [Allosphingosinicella sp.]